MEISVISQIIIASLSAFGILAYIANILRSFLSRSKSLSIKLRNSDGLEISVSDEQIKELIEKILSVENTMPPKEDTK